MDLGNGSSESAAKKLRNSQDLFKTFYKLLQPSAVRVLVDQKQLENVEYFKYLGAMIKNDA